MSGQTAVGEIAQSGQYILDIKTDLELESDKYLDDKYPLTFVDAAVTTHVDGNDSREDDEDGDPLAISVKKEFKVEKWEGDVEISDNFPEELNKNDGAKHIFCCICKKYSKVTDTQSDFGQMAKTMCDFCYNTNYCNRKSKWMDLMCKTLESCLICLNVFHNCLNFTDHDCTCKSSFSCKNCWIIFNRKDDIIKHVVNCGSQLNNSTLVFRLKVGSKNGKIEKADDKRFSCKVCNKTFTFGSTLKQHAHMHTGKKPFRCNICMKTFSQAGHLNVHTRIHTGEKPFCCNVCNKTFTESSSLKKHTLSHTGEKPFCCNICDKTFSVASSLKMHTRIHTGEKPFCCKFCDKTFSLAGNLKIHTRIHSGKKLFNCNICEKTFRHSNSLKMHTYIHTGEKPFRCNICTKTFSQACNLKRHSHIHG